MSAVASSVATTPPARPHAGRLVRVPILRPRIVVRPEFESLWRSRTGARLEQLERRLLSRLHVPRFQVQARTDALLERFDEYRLCVRHKLRCEVDVVELPDDAAARIWIVENILGDAPESVFCRVELVLRVEPDIRARAKERQGRRTDIRQDLAGGLARTARDEMAALAGTNGETFRRARQLARQAPEDLLGRLRRDEITIHAAFQEMIEGRRPQSVEGRCDSDASPEVVLRRTRKGDLWILGRHRLLCGNACDPAGVERLLAGAAPELLITDPPYSVDHDAARRGVLGTSSVGSAVRQQMKPRSRGHRVTKILNDDRADWSEAFELVPSLRVAYVWHASRHAIEVGAGLRRIGFELRHTLVWKKPHWAFSRSHYHHQFEPFYLAVREGCNEAWIGTRDQSDIWEAASPKVGDNNSTGADAKQDHPHQKPVLFMERPLQNHDFAEVYDPFVGSGTTLIAAERLGRTCYAMDLCPGNCDTTVARWEQFTGKKAERQKR